MVPNTIAGPESVSSATALLFEYYRYCKNPLPPQPMTKFFNKGPHVSYGKAGETLRLCSESQGWYFKPRGCWIVTTTVLL